VVADRFSLARTVMPPVVQYPVHDVGYPFFKVSELARTLILTLTLTLALALALTLLLPLPTNHGPWSWP